MSRTILIVDDEKVNREILKHILQNEYQILEASDGRQALEQMRLNSEILSAVLLDVVMPEMDGYETLDHIRNDAMLSQIPVIIVTGATDETSRTKALALGASDFLVKPFSPGIILHCLKNNIALRETTSIVNTMRIDKLTGLYNMDAFFEIAKEQIMARESGYYVLSCININNFKVINDQYGRDVGDRVLQHVADCIRGNISSAEGICCRLMGDRFAVLFPSRYRNDGSQDAFHDAISSPSFINQTLTVRVGRYLVTDRSLPVNAMCDRGALAADSIKGQYGLYVAEFDESMRQELLEEQMVVNQMTEALENGEFEPWFQPQYNHADGSLIGAEALARWRRDGKIIPPFKFIPVFEKNGFIYQMDKSIWEQTCACLRKWLDSGLQVLPVSVNISRQDIFCDDLFEVITAMTDKYDIPAELLRLEVTESAFGEFTDEIVAVVKRLIDYGYTVEIDDFGSGYSSLNTLKDVPAQILKLDMKFFAHSGHTQRGGNIVQSIIRMAKWLNMSVIAEGVETPEQADFLKSIGCYYIQGYLYSRPVPLSDYEVILAGSQQKRPELNLLESVVENFDENNFWNPDSIDSIVFNNFIGGACVCEPINGVMEMLRLNDNFIKELGIMNRGGEFISLFSPFRYIPPSEQQRLLDCMENAKTSEQEIELKLADDGKRFEIPQYVRFSIRALCRISDRYLFCMLAKNVTAQRLAEQKESEASERISTIMNHVDGGISVASIHPDGTVSISLANRKYYELFGYTEKEFKERFRDATDLVYEPDLPETMQHVSKVLSEHTKATYEYRCWTSDGSLVWIRTSSVVVSLGGVGERLLLALSSDVTHEREQESMLRTITGSMPGGLLSFEFKDGAIRTLYFSEGCYRSTGYTREEYLEASKGNGLSLLHEEDRPVVIEMITSRLMGIRESDQAMCECRILHKDGTYHWYSAKGQVSTIQDQGFIFNAVLLDIDDFKNTKQQLSEQQRELQALVSATPGGIFRYSADTDEFSFVSDGMYKSLGLTPQEFRDRFHNHFSEMVWHEDREEAFRKIKSDLESNSRTVVCEYRIQTRDGKFIWILEKAHLITDEKGERCFVAVALDISERKKMEAILGRENKQLQVLTETDMLTGVLNRTAFASKVDGIIRTFGPEARHALMMLDLDNFKLLNDSLGHTAGDQMLVDTAANLHSVLRKSDLIARLGGDEFVVFLANIQDDALVEQKARQICGLVHHSFGNGMEISTSIGIAITPDDGGDFQTLYTKADSALYHIKGSGKNNFAFFSDEMTPDHPETLVERSGNGTENPKLRMLVVDDNPVEISIMANLFENQFIIEKAPNGSCALSMLRRLRTSVSVVLLDLMMPGIDGFAVLKTMQENLELQKIPVIVVSGAEDRETCIRAIRSGATDFVTKPFDAGVLRSRVSAAVLKSEKTRNDNSGK